VLIDEAEQKDSPTHDVLHQPTPLARAAKRARTGATPPVGICFEDKKGEEKIEVELEKIESTNSDTTPSPHDPDEDEDEFAFRAPTFLFNTPPRRSNVTFDERPTASAKRRYGFLNRVIQSAKKSATRNVSSVGRLLRSAKKAASRNVSALLKSAQKVSGRNDGTSDEIIDAAIQLLLSEVVKEGFIREDVMGLAVAVFDLAAKQETDPTRPFQVKYKLLDAKKRRTKVYAEIPIPRPARRDTTQESRKRTTRDRSARMHAYAESLCEDNVDEQQAGCHHMPS
jgi:hypothetical protein